MYAGNCGVFGVEKVPLVERLPRLERRFEFDRKR